MSTRTIAIVGITGNQGGSVADTFLQEGDWKIRGITRNPNKVSSKEWADKGVEVVAGELDNVETLKAAFKGANVVFGATDFWQFMQDPVVAEQAKKEGRTPNEVSYDRELQHGKNLVDAAAANIDTLDRFVLSTLSPSEKLSGGKIKWNKHFDAKWAAVEYLKATYPELAKKTSFLQLGLFATNWKSGMAPRKQEDGTFKAGLPMSGDRKFGMVDPRADTGPMVRALVDLPAGKNALAAGSFINFNEFWGDLWANHVGVKCVYERSDRKFYEQTLGYLGIELADMFQYIDEFGYDGSDPSVQYAWDLEKELGRTIPRTTMEEYVKKTDWSSIL